MTGLLAAALALLSGLTGPAGDAPEAEVPAGPAAVVEIIKAPLEELRGLSFTSDLRILEVDRPTARRHLERLVKEEYGPGELQAEERALRYLGLLDRPSDLEHLLLDLLEGQVAGFYDPATRTLYVVPGPLAGSLATAHEMAHALADQHFGLQALREAAGGDEDREMALAALVEGEATMVTYLWAIRSAMDPAMPPLAQGDPAELMQEAARGLEGVPPFLKESLLFPYMAGALWAGGVMRQGGGLKALNPFFLDPPESTEQILHPERSLPPRDRPSVIAPGLPASGLPQDARVIKENSMGEFGIRFLLGGPSRETAVEAAEGWDADRYVLAGSGEDLHLTWISVWDSGEDAEEFASALREWLQGRAGQGAGTFAVEAEGAVVAAAEGDAGEGYGPAARVERILRAVPGGVTSR